MPSPARFFKRSRAAGINGVWILVSLDKHLRTHLKDHTRHDQDPEIHSRSTGMLLPVGEAQLAGCLKAWVSGWSKTQASSDYAQGVIQDTVYEASVSTATPNWCAVLSC